MRARARVCVCVCVSHKIRRRGRGESAWEAATLRSLTTVVPLSEARPNSIFIFIFDDVAYNKQDTVREYFSMGRHATASLCQTYEDTYLICGNANLLILQTGQYQLETRLQQSREYRYDEFCALYHDCWRQKYGFLVIDKDSALKNGRYRKRFNEFAILISRYFARNEHG